MADVNKTIEIQYKADLGQLLAQLKKLPNMTEKEAKKMVSELNKQLRRAEKEAKKAGKAMSQSMKQSAGSMASVGDAAAEMREEMGSVAEKAGDVDRGFAAMGLALSGVNPQLAEGAMLLADAGAVTEGLLMSVSALNPAIIASGVAIGTLTLGVFAYMEAQEKAKQLMLDVKSAQDQYTESISATADVIRGSLDAYDKINDKYKLMTGQMTEFEFKTKEASSSAEAAFASQIKFSEDQIKLHRDDLKMIKSLAAGNKNLSESDKDRLLQLQRQNDNVRNSIDLMSKGLAVEAELHKMIMNATDELSKSESHLAGHNELRDKAIQLSKEMVEIEADMASVTEAQADATNDTAKSAQELAAAQQIIDTALQSQMSSVELVNLQFDTQKTALEDIRSKYGEIAGINEALEAIEAQRSEALVSAREQDLAEERNLAELKKQIADDLAGVRKKYRLTELSDQLAGNALMELSELDLHQLRLQLMNEEGKEFEALSKLIDAELKRRTMATQTAINTTVKSSMMMLSAVSQLAGQEAGKIEEQMDRQLTNLEELEESRIKHVENAVEAGILTESAGAKAKAKIEKDLADERLKIEREMGQEAYKARMAEFRLNQTTASSNVVMSTAVAIAKALELGPIAGPIAAGFISAAGLAQLAVVANQQPPAPTFDVGGMIGSRDPMRPDDAMIRARQGEAILDRATVQRLGGERGVRDLQQSGQSGSPVVMISPWKHFDRFNRARQRAGLNQSKSGQRGY